MLRKMWKVINLEYRQKNHCHASASWHPVELTSSFLIATKKAGALLDWVPACAGMTMKFFACFRKILLVILSAFILSACAVKLPDTSTYILTLPPQSVNVANAPITNDTLFISQPTAAPGANTQKMAYVEEAYQLQYFTKNQWVDTPADMLLPLMVQTLQNTHRFKAVVGAPFSGAATLRLDTTVLALRQNFMTKPGQENLVVYARLIRTNTQQVIASQRFAVEAPVPAETPYGGVQAANQAVSLFLQQLTQFVLKNRLNSPLPPAAEGIDCSNRPIPNHVTCVSAN